MKRILNPYKPYLALVIIILIGYWQVAFLFSSFKWDMLNVVFPFRYHFSECIQSGFFPFWNPYQQTGTPFYADLQAPVYYPELLITSLFTGYNLYIMHFLFIGYLLIAGFGMYKLSYHFNKSIYASVLAGISYAFSGFIIGHGQHFFLIVGTAWIPFVILSYYRLLQERTLPNTFKSSVFIFLMISGAYQALSFSLMYILLAIFLYFIILNIIQKDAKSVFSILKYNSYLLFIVLILSLPLIVSTLEVMPYVDRLGHGINLNSTLKHGQTIRSLISIILPFSTFQYNEFFGNVDISMRNHYFGLITLFFFTASILRKLSITEYILLFAGLIIMGSSFAVLPVREFMFKHVPLMNLFLYAAYIRVFGIFAFIFLAANYIADFEKNMEQERKRMLIIGICFALLIFLLVLFSTTKISKSDLKFYLGQNNLFDVLKNIPFHLRIILQGNFQLLISLAFITILIYYNKFKKPLYLIFALFVIEIITAAQLNMGFTVATSHSKPNRMQKDLNLYPKKFPVPINDKVIFNDHQHASYPPLYLNTYIFSKQVSFLAFSSFELNSYSKLDDEFIHLKDAAINNHLFYFSDSILPHSQLIDSCIDKQEHSGILFFADSVYNTLKDFYVKTDSSDNIKIVQFQPDNIRINTTTKNQMFLTLLQTNFKGWKAYIDGKETPIYTSNFNYRTIILPEGQHVVAYKYKNNKIIILYLVSNIFFLAIILGFLFYWLKRKRIFTSVPAVIIPIIVTVIIALFAIKHITFKNNSATTHEILHQRWSKMQPAFHFETSFEDDTASSDTIHYFSGNKSRVIDSLSEYIHLTNIDNRNYRFKKGTLVLTARIFPQDYTQTLICSDYIRDYNSTEWQAFKIERQIEHLDEWNEIIYCRNYYKLKKDDEIRLFLWNLKKEHFHIDHITVDFYTDFR